MSYIFQLFNVYCRFIQSTFTSKEKQIMMYSEIFLLAADTDIQSTYEYMSVETHSDAIDVAYIF